MQTKSDFFGNLFTFFRCPNCWTPRTINAFIDESIKFEVNFWDLAQDKLGDFGVQDLVKVMGVAHAS